MIPLSSKRALRKTDPFVGTLGSSSLFQHTPSGDQVRGAESDPHGEPIAAVGEELLDRQDAGDGRLDLVPVAELSADHISGGQFRHGSRLIRWRTEKLPRTARWISFGKRGKGDRSDRDGAVASLSRL